MKKKNPIEVYSADATLRSYERIIDVVNDKFGQGAAYKHPALVSTLLRFQEEMIRSTTELIVSGKLDIEKLLSYIENK